MTVSRRDPRFICSRAFERAYHVVAHSPLIQRVPFYRLGCQARHELLVLESLERELVAHLLGGVVATHIGYLARLNLHLDIGAEFDLSVLDIGVGVGDALHVGRRNDIGAENEGGGGDDGRADHVGAQQAPEAHACREHGDYLGVVGQFRGEEDDRYEGEQRAELIGEIGQEVQEIVEDGGVERSLEERVELLVDVEHHRDGQYQRYGEDIGSEELLENIAVENLEHGGQRRRVTRSTISVFQLLKSPSRIWRRASPVSQR